MGDKLLCVCGDDVEVKADKDKRGTIVIPCKNCMNEERSEGYNEGYDEGYSDGYDKGLDEGGEKDV